MGTSGTVRAGASAATAVTPTAPAAAAGEGVLCAHSVATAIAGVFANFANKIDKIPEKLEDVDKAKSQGVSCQY